MIEIKNLCKNYDGVTVDDDLNFQLQYGDLTQMVVNLQNQMSTIQNS